MTAVRELDELPDGDAEFLAALDTAGQQLAEAWRLATDPDDEDRIARVGAELDAIVRAARRRLRVGPAVGAGSWEALLTAGG